VAPADTAETMLTALARGATLRDCLRLANTKDNLGQTADADKNRPKVLVIPTGATGGTIAGVQDNLNEACADCGSVASGARPPDSEISCVM